ncbi:putative glycoside hydrolase [Vibrio sp. CAU 1672]|uniref:putative glycoside hydrolase n=1 Tax=Vibrio sp. CAU 1672 TaxID=3032594 RepID=UPI0023DCE159|nr:putative glycoside hydrolase [Vibrio sp. CAU 1672]MDF2152791.1 putative glycoside hydrolase [Vibrio sp. CAU 1672]
MEKHTKTLLTAAISVSLLNGCLELDDPYSPPESSQPPTLKEIYSPQSDGSYALSIVDQADIEAQIDANGNALQDNVATTGLNDDNNPPVNFKVSGSAKGRLQAKSADGNAVDLGVSKENSTLQFDFRSVEKPTLSQPIYVSAQQTAGIDSTEVALSSAALALAGSATQTLKIPLSCFDMDFTQTVTPFVLHSEGNLDVDVGNIRVVTNSIEGDSSVLECTNNSTFLKPDADSENSNIFIIGNPSLGWANAITTWMTDGSDLQLDWGHDSFSISYPAPQAGANGGIILQPNDGNPRDVAAYVATGVLEFMLNVESYGSHPTKKLQVQMESTYGNSQPYFLPAGFAENSWQQVRIPLKTLFTKSDGSIDINVLRNINKPLSLLPEWISEGDTLAGMKYTIAGVKLVMNP